MMGAVSRSTWGVCFAGLVLTVLVSSVIGQQVGGHAVNDPLPDETPAPAIAPDTPPTPDAPEDAPPAVAEPNAIEEPLVEPEPPEPVPAQMLAELYSLINPYAMDPPPANQAEFNQRFTEQQTYVIDQARAVMEAHADAPNLDDLRLIMLEAAMFLYYSDETNRPLLNSTCDEVLAGTENPDVAILADTLKLMAAIETPEASADALIADYLASYADSDQLAEATLSAAILAEQNDLPGQLATLTDLLEASYADEGAVVRFLHSQGRTVKMTGQMTMFNGETLTLPNDLAGKAAVIAFTDGPSPIGEQVDDYLITLRDRFSADRVEIVSVYVNPPGNAAALSTYIAGKDISWLTAYDDATFCPLAVDYQIEATPSIWILDVEGNIVTDDAMDHSATTLTDALANIAPLLEDALSLDDTTMPVTPEPEPDVDPNAPVEPTDPDDSAPEPAPPVPPVSAED